MKFTRRGQQVNYYIWYLPLTRTLPHFFSQPIGSHRQTLHLNSLWLLIAVRHRNLELSFLLFKVSHHFLSSELQIVDGILFLVAPSPSSTSDSIGYHTPHFERGYWAAYTKSFDHIGLRVDHEKFFGINGDSDVHHDPDCDLTRKVSCLYYSVNW
ncbi:hypothetical protein Q3G72_014044 [Acer saccharum]|nr:hypothetical protein Q3G72_014044 [Acer saccharum]